MKAILIMDMPSNCIGCRFNDMGFCEASHDGGEWIPDEVIDNKPKWCPLKEIPEKYEIESMGFERGYNACIDDISKE